MTCDCLNKLEANLRKEYEDPEARLERHLIMNMQSGDNGMRWPSAEFEYRPKKADGTFSKKKNNLKVYPAYCPVCGKRYEEEK